MAADRAKQVEAVRRGHAMREAADQLALPLGRPAKAAGVEAVSMGRRAITVHFVRRPRARHYVLRVLADGEIQLTLPRYGSRADALTFLRRQWRWVDMQRYAAARNDAVILFRGEVQPMRVDRTATPPTVWFGDRHVEMRPGEKPRAAVCRHLREIARAELGPRLLELANGLGLVVRRVTIRNQQTRWGSCSSDGAISLNWRLVQMPPAVRDYILVHELVHLREAGHGRRFWQRLEQACPGHHEARRWLKAHAHELV